MRDIIFGDSIIIMKSMIESGKTVDLICCDPPYRLTSGGKNTGELGGCLSNDSYSNDGNIVDCDIDWPDFMPLFFQVLKSGCHAYVMANNRNVQAMLNAAEDAGFGFHNLLVWDKITCTPNRWYAKNCEFVGFFYKGRAKYIKDCGCKQLIRCPQKDETIHPNEKPIELMKHYIRNSSNVGDIVFDPFAGSGSAGVAAVLTGRNYLLIEKNPTYFDICKKRVQDAERQSNLDLIDDRIERATGSTA